MMRELGGVFGIAVVVAVFAAAGSYASPVAFVDGFAPAIGVGALLALDRRRRRPCASRPLNTHGSSPQWRSTDETGHGALQGQA